MLDKIALIAALFICWVLPISSAHAEISAFARGQAHFRQGRFDEASRSWRAALQEASCGSSGHIDILRSLSHASRKLGRYQEASQWLDKALPLAEQNWDVPREALIHSDLSDIYRVLWEKHGKHPLSNPKALNAIREAIEAVEFARIDPDIKISDKIQAAVLIQAGHIYALHRDYKKAKEYYQEALSILPAHKQKSADTASFRAQILINLAQLFIDVQRYKNDKEKEDFFQGELHVASEKIITAYTDALSAVRGLSDDYKKAGGLLHLSRIIRLVRTQTHKFPGFPAEKRHDLIAKISLELRDIRPLIEAFPILVSYTDGYLAQLYQDNGQYTDAIALTRQAIFQAQKPPVSSDLLFRWERQLGQLWRKQDKMDSAIAAYKRSLEHLVKIRPTLSATRYGSTHQEYRDIESTQVYFELIGLLLEKAKKEKDKNIKSYKNTLHKARKIIEKFRNAELNEYFQGECRGYGGNGERTGEKESRGRACFQKNAGFLSTIENKTALLYFVIFKERVELLLCLGGGNIIHLYEDVDKIDLETHIDDFYNELTEKQPDSVKKLQYYGGKLYDWLIRPVEPYLKNASTLVLIPDGRLRTIPLAALYDAQNEQYLIEKHALATVAGVELLSESPEQPNDGVFLGGISEPLEFYHPKEKFGGLPCVPQELKVLENIHHDKNIDKLLDKRFTLENFDKFALSKPYRIVHIASHGKFERNFKDSFLAAHNGRLGMDSLDKLARAGKIHDNSLELLTLSACETASGDEKEMLGLAGVAMRAGAKTVVASLWKVNDKATCYLMAAFYHYLKDPAVSSKAEALQKAQIGFLTDKGRQYWKHCDKDQCGQTNALKYPEHPVHWSAFVLIGNWR